MANHRMFNGLDVFGKTTPVPTVVESLNTIIRGMLRTTYAYADDQPQAVFLYIQLTDDSTSMDSLFQIDGQLFEADALNDAPGRRYYDVSQERQNRLQQFYVQDVQEKLLPLFKHSRRMIPSEIWASFDVEKNCLNLRLGYQFGSILPSLHDGLQQWKQELKNPLPAPWNQKIHLT